MLAQALFVATALLTCPALAQTGPLELTQNGGFETGDFTGWTLFPSAPGNITVSTPGSNSAFAGCIDNTVLASASLIKNANIGVGTVVPGETVTISFDAKGSTAVGGVAIAEFFSELSGGGVSSSVILGGGPLALDPDPNVWKSFSFTTTTGSNVSGGVTLQLAAITGGAPGSVSSICYDNASVTVDRTCGTLSVIGPGTPGTNLTFDVNGGANASAYLVFGSNPGITSINLGTLGTLELGLTFPFTLLPLGMTDANGDTSQTILLPNGGLANGSLLAQSLTVALSTGPGGQPTLDFCTSAVETITFSGF